MRVLVAYASRHGATAEIALRIADRLRESGFDTDCVSVTEDPLVATYDAFVVGSAVYIGHWEKDAIRFVESHQHVLAERPTWLFSSGPLGTEPTLHSGEDKLEGAVNAEERQRLAELVNPRGHAVFFGAFDPGKQNLAVRLFRVLPAAKRLLEAGDFRDWDAIEAWTDEVAEALETTALAAR